MLHLQTTQQLEEEHLITPLNDYVFDLAERTRQQQGPVTIDEAHLSFKTSGTYTVPVSSMKNVLILYGDKGSQLKSTQGIDDWNNDYLVKQKQDLKNYYPLEPTKLNKLVQYTKTTAQDKKVTQSSLQKTQPSSRNETPAMVKRAQSVPPNLMLLKKTKEKVLKSVEPFQIRDTFLTEIDATEEDAEEEGEEEFTEFEKQIYQHLLDMEWIDEHFQNHGEEIENISTKNKISKLQLRDAMKKFGKQERVRLNFPAEEILQSTKRLERVKRGESYIRDLHELPSFDVLFPPISLQHASSTSTLTMDEQFIKKLEGIMSSFKYSAQKEEELNEFMNKNQKSKQEEEEEETSKLIDKKEMVDWLKPVFAIDQPNTAVHSKIEHYLENSFVKSTFKSHSVKANLHNLKQKMANTFTTTKIQNQYSLLQLLDHRTTSRDGYIYKSKSGLGKVSGNALQHAKQWHEYRVQSHGNREWKENIWSKAKSEFTQHNAQLYEAILLYKKLQLLLQYYRMPRDTACATMVESIRLFLIQNQKIIKPDVLVDAIQYTGSSSTQSHECLVVFHFVVTVLDWNAHEILDLIQKKFNFAFSREWKEFKHTRVKRKKNK